MEDVNYLTRKPAREKKERKIRLKVAADVLGEMRGGEEEGGGREREGWQKGGETRWAGVARSQGELVERRGGFFFFF